MSHAYLPASASERPRLTAAFRTSPSLPPVASFPSAPASSSRSVASIR